MIKSFFINSPEVGAILLLGAFMDKSMVNNRENTLEMEKIA